MGDPSTQSNHSSLLILPRRHPEKPPAVKFKAVVFQSDHAPASGDPVSLMGTVMVSVNVSKVVGVVEAGTDGARVVLEVYVAPTSVETIGVSSQVSEVVWALEMVDEPV